MEKQSHQLKLKIGIFFLAGFALIAGVLSATVRSFFMPSESAESIFLRVDATCQDSKDRTAYILCVRSRFTRFINAYGVRPFMIALANMAVAKDSDLSLKSHCHDIAHALGQEGVRASTDPQAALVQCTSICGAGCYHGVVEAFLAEGGSFKQAIQTLCAIPYDKSERDRTRWACFHGLGHGIASITGDFTSSIALCDRVTEDDDKKNCDRGVIMELFQSASFTHEQLPVPTDVLSLCTDLSGVHRSVCFENAGLQEYIGTNDLDRAVSVCGRVPMDSAENCLALLGNKIYHDTVGDVEKILALCEKVGVNLCLRGAIQEDVLTNPAAQTGVALCSRTDESLKGDCFVYLSDRIGATYGSDVRTGFCNQLSDAHRIFCMRTEGEDDR